MDANQLAHEIHRRRVSMDANSPRHAAAGIARFCSEFGIEPTTDHFDPYLNLLLGNDDETMTLVTGNASVWEIKDTRVCDYYIFTRGERLAETAVVGWLTKDRVLAAPQVRGRTKASGVTFIVDAKCVYPMPAHLDITAKSFGLKEPDMDAAAVWNYDLQALWTPLGFHVYDKKAAQMVAQTDLEMSR